MNQYSRSSKSLNSLKNLFFELNAVKIFESPRDLQRIATQCAGATLLQGGGGGGTGGVYAICIWPRTKIRKIESVNQTPSLAAPTPQ